MLHAWLASSLKRTYPSTRPEPTMRSRMDAALNGRFSFQVAFRSALPDPRWIRLETECPAGWELRVRRVGYVPVPHYNTKTPPAEREGEGCIPGYVPDPLFDEDRLLLPPEETHAFWITVRPGKGVAPGVYRLRMNLVDADSGKVLASRCAGVRLHDVVLGKRKNFTVTNWFYVDSLVEYYKTDLFDRKFWAILPAYVRNMKDHGQDMLYVPVFTPPLDGVKRPSQLLSVQRKGADSYAFDWTDVRKYVRTAKRCGIKTFEWSHLFSQWGAERAIRIYHGQGADERLLWSPGTGGTAKTYKTFLSHYLPALYRFLAEEDLLEASVFHVSDEPYTKHIGNYRKVRALLKELAPWMKVMDALSDVEFGRRGLVDMPVPSIKTAPAFIREDIDCWCYYCAGPRGTYLNRLLDTPLAKIAMHGYAFYRFPVRGFLHWGYNYWNESQTRRLIDPYTVQDAHAWPHWAYGDPFMVYPGPRGPVDSIRWEVFSESLQDYALLQTLGIERDDPVLKGITGFDGLPWSERWVMNTRRALFRRTGRKAPA